MPGRLAAPCTRSVIADKILRACQKLTFLTNRGVKNGVDQRFNPLLCHRSKLNGIILQSPLQLQAIHQCRHACTSSINMSLTSIIDDNPPLFTLKNEVLVPFVTKPGIAATEKLSTWVIFRDCFSRKNNLSCISKRPPLREAQPGMPGKTSLALMTSLAQKLTMLLLGHACTTLLDDRSHDGPPIDRSLQLRVNRIVSYNFFPTLGRARASQGDNPKKFSRLSVPHHSGNCW